MLTVPSYPKILTLGSAYTDAALDGPVQIQEKVDGSQFGFGVNGEYELVFRSKGVPNLEPEAAPDLFRPSIEHIVAQYKAGRLVAPPDTYFYAEAVARPKHNTLAYETVPPGNTVLFDMMTEGRFVGRPTLEAWAKQLEVAAVPLLWEGEATQQVVRGFMGYRSFLGNTAEGVVVKNYGQTIQLGGQVFPLFTKLVREDFKEQNDKEWRAPKATFEDYLRSFATPARFEKAAQHLAEAGVLTGELRDIGPLVREVQRDLLEEEEANIKEALFARFKDEIVRNTTRAVPQWYKDRLLEAEA